MDGPGLLISGGIALTLASEPGPSLSTGWWPQYAVRYEGNWRHQTIAGFCYQDGFRLRRHLRVAATSVRRPSSTGHRSSYGTAQPGDRQRAQLFAFLQDSSSPIGVSGCGRLSPAVCGECARKLLWESAFSLVSALSPMVCKSIAKASKVRILHLPPRVREGL